MKYGFKMLFINLFNIAEGKGNAPEKMPLKL